MLSSSPLSAVAGGTPARSSTNAPDGLYAFSPSPGTGASSYISVMNHLEEFDCHVPTKPTAALPPSPVVGSTSREALDARAARSAKEASLSSVNSSLSRDHNYLGGTTSSSHRGSARELRAASAAELLAHAGDAKSWMDTIPISPIHAAKAPVRRVSDLELNTRSGPHAGQSDGEEKGVHRQRPPSSSPGGAGAAAPTTATAPSVALRAAGSGDGRLPPQGGVGGASAAQSAVNDIAALRLNLNALLLQQAAPNAAEMKPATDARQQLQHSRDHLRSSSGHVEAPRVGGATHSPPLPPRSSGSSAGGPSRPSSHRHSPALGPPVPHATAHGSFPSNSSASYHAVGLAADSAGRQQAPQPPPVAPRRPPSASHSAPHLAADTLEGMRVETSSGASPTVQRARQQQQQQPSTLGDPLMRAIAASQLWGRQAPSASQNSVMDSNGSAAGERGRSRLRQEVQQARAQEEFDHQASELATRLDAQLELVFTLMRKIMVLDAQQQQRAASRVGAPLHDGGVDACASAAASDVEERRDALVLQLETSEGEVVDCTLRYVELVNRHALQWMNEGHFTAALQLLGRADALLHKNAGRLFRYLPDAVELSSSSLSSSPSSSSARDDVMRGQRHVGSGGSHATATTPGMSNDDVCSLSVPFFPPSQEPARLTAAAAVEHNLGIYHFKIGEYALAASRFARTAAIEEELQAAGIGITYFNMAQAQHELHHSQEALQYAALAEEAVERQIFAAKDAATRRRRQLARQHAFSVADVPDSALDAVTGAMSRAASPSPSSELSVLQRSAASAEFPRGDEQSRLPSPLPQPSPPLLERAAAGQQPRGDAAQERELLHLWLRWREGVCFMACIKQAHAAWLSEAGQYKAAFHVYRQAHTWLTSVPRLAPEEQRRAQKLKDQMAKVKRRWRREEVELEMYPRPLQDRAALAGGRRGISAHTCPASQLRASSRRKAPQRQGGAGTSTAAAAAGAVGSGGAGQSLIAGQTWRGLPTPLRSTVVTSLLPRAVEVTTGRQRERPRVPSRPPPPQQQQQQQPSSSSVTASVMVAAARSPLQAAEGRRRPSSANAALYAAYLSRPSTENTGQPTASRRPSTGSSRTGEKATAMDAATAAPGHRGVTSSARPDWDASTHVPVPPPPPLHDHRPRPSRPSSGAASRGVSSAVSSRRNSNSLPASLLGKDGATGEDDGVPAGAGQDTRRALLPLPESHLPPLPPHSAHGTSRAAMADDGEETEEPSAPPHPPFHRTTAAAAGGNNGGGRRTSRDGAVPLSAPESVVRSLLFNDDAVTPKRPSMPPTPSHKVHPSAAGVMPLEIEKEPYDEQQGKSEERQAWRGDGARENARGGVANESGGAHGLSPDTTGTPASVRAGAAAAAAPRRKGDLTWCVTVLQAFLRCLRVLDESRRPPLSREATRPHLDDSSLASRTKPTPTAAVVTPESYLLVAQREVQSSEGEGQEEEEEDEEGADVEDNAATLQPEQHVSSLPRSTEVLMLPRVPLPAATGAAGDATTATIVMEESERSIVVSSSTSSSGSEENSASYKAVQSSAARGDHPADTVGSKSHHDDNTPSGNTSHTVDGFQATVVQPALECDLHRSSDGRAGTLPHRYDQATSSLANSSSDAAAAAAASPQQTLPKSSTPCHEETHGMPARREADEGCDGGHSQYASAQNVSPLSGEGATPQSRSASQLSGRPDSAIGSQDERVTTSVGAGNHTLHEHSSRPLPTLSETLHPTEQAACSPSHGGRSSRARRHSHFEGADSLAERSPYISRDSINASSLDRRSFISADALVEPEEEEDEEDEEDEEVEEEEEEEDEDGEMHSSAATSSASYRSSSSPSPAASVEGTPLGSEDGAEAAQGHAGQTDGVQRATHAHSAPDALFRNHAMTNPDSGSTDAADAPPAALTAAHETSPEAESVDTPREAEAEADGGEEAEEVLDDAAGAEKQDNAETAAEGGSGGATTGEGDAAAVSEREAVDALVNDDPVDVKGSPSRSTQEDIALQAVVGAGDHVGDGVTVVSAGHMQDTLEVEEEKAAPLEVDADQSALPEERDSQFYTAETETKSEGNSSSSHRAEPPPQQTTNIETSSTAPLVTDENHKTADEAAHSETTAETADDPSVVAVAALAIASPSGGQTAAVQPESRDLLSPDLREETPAEIDLLRISGSSWSVGAGESPEAERQGAQATTPAAAATATVAGGEGRGEGEDGGGADGAVCNVAGGPAAAPQQKTPARTGPVAVSDFYADDEKNFTYVHPRETAHQTALPRAATAAAASEAAVEERKEARCDEPFVAHATTDGSSKSNALHSGADTAAPAVVLAADATASTEGAKGDEAAMVGVEMAPVALDQQHSGDEKDDAPTPRGGIASTGEDAAVATGDAHPPSALTEHALSLKSAVSVRHPAGEPRRPPSDDMPHLMASAHSSDTGPHASRLSPSLRDKYVQALQGNSDKANTQDHPSGNVDTTPAAEVPTAAAAAEELVCRPPSAPAPPARRVRVFVFAPPRAATPATADLTQLTASPARSEEIAVDRSRVVEQLSDTAAAKTATPATPPLAALQHPPEETEMLRSFARLSPSVTTGTTDAHMSFNESYYCDLAPEERSATLAAAAGEAAGRRNVSSASTVTQLSQLRASFWRSLHERLDERAEDGALRSVRSNSRKNASGVASVPHSVASAKAASVPDGDAAAAAAAEPTVDGAAGAAVVAPAGEPVATPVDREPPTDAGGDTQVPEELHAFQQQLIAHHGIDIVGDVDAPPFLSSGRRGTATPAHPVQLATPVVKATPSLHTGDTTATTATTAAATTLGEGEEATGTWSGDGNADSEPKDMASRISAVIIPLSSSSPPPSNAPLSDIQPSALADVQQQPPPLESAPESGPAMSDVDAPWNSAKRSDGVRLEARAAVTPEDAMEAATDALVSYPPSDVREEQEQQRDVLSGSDPQCVALPPPSHQPLPPQPEQQQQQEPASSAVPFVAPGALQGILVRSYSSPKALPLEEAVAALPAADMETEEMERQYIREQIVCEEAATVIQLAWRDYVAWGNPKRTFTTW